MHINFIKTSLFFLLFLFALNATAQEGSVAVGSSYQYSLKLKKYYAQREFTKAINYGDSVLIELKKDQEEIHSELASIQYYLALSYKHLGEHEKSRASFETSIEIIYQIEGEESQQLENLFLNLARLEFTLGNYLEAIAHFKMGIYFTDKSNNGRTIDYFLRLNELGSMYKSAGANKEALATFKKANEIFIHILNKEDYIFQFQSAIFRDPESLFIKEIFSFEQFKQNNFNIASQNKYNNYVNSFRKIAQEMYLAWLFYQTTNSSVFMPTESLPKQKPKDALIHFSHFRYQDINNNMMDSIFYVAYLIYKDNRQSEMVFLFELDSILASQTENIIQSQQTRGTSLGLKPAQKKVDKTDLFKLIWEPIIPYLDGISNLYIIPSGFLNKINLGAIPIDSSGIIADFYSINLLSTAQKFIIAIEKEYTNTAMVLGGLDYNDASLNDAIIRDSSKSKGLLPREIKNNKKELNYLLGTKIEADTVSQLLGVHGYKVALLLGKNGTEDVIKQFDKTHPSPRILHIATHGYFFPISSKVESLNEDCNIKNSQDPLIRSGLILAGANKAWQGQSPPSGQEDGILTAYEISHLDLSETELVVLSACETALGDIRGTEGVYGLQRGFKMAGVKYIIMSLWKVPDHETQEMMVLFYKKWLEDKLTIPNAFRAAQKEMRKKYENEPFKWAGFILVE